MVNYKQVFWGGIVRFWNHFVYNYGILIINFHAHMLEKQL